MEEEGRKKVLDGVSVKNSEDDTHTYTRSLRMGRISTDRCGRKALFSGITRAKARPCPLAGGHLGL